MINTLNSRACRVIVVAVLTLMNGNVASQEEFAKQVPSAVIETRDGPTEKELAAPTKVVVLGTGNPIPDAHRAGPGIAVIHRGEAYLFDVGAGSIRNAVIARYKYDIPSLYPSEICCVFLSHMHSDHTMDYSELVYTLWWRRREPVRAWGPKGLNAMNAGMDAMMAADTALRLSGVQPIRNRDSFKVQSTEIEAGIVHKADGIVIEAIDARHGDIKPAFSFRVTTDDKVIVISGDTAYNEELLELSRGVDVLIHEAISDSGLAETTEFWQNYHRSSHTVASDLGRLATEAKPGLLVIYHALFYGVPEENIMDEVRSTYDGEVVLAKDLDVF